MFSWHLLTAWWRFSMHRRCPSRVAASRFFWAILNPRKWFPVRGNPARFCVGTTLFFHVHISIRKDNKITVFERMIYADDTQVYAVLTESDREAVIDNLEHCLFNIKEWSTQNDLKLNSDKTEVIHVKSSLRNPSPLSVINVADSAIEPIIRARDLGVILDSGLDMQYHVRNKCKSAAMGLHKIGKIRKYLDRGTTEKLVHAFITCHLDNNNGLLYGIPDTLLRRMQYIQNSAARLITQKEKVWLNISNSTRTSLATHKISD